MTNLIRDLRYALRSLRRTPTFTVSAIVCLALGIGATSTAFGIVDALFFRSPAGVEGASAIVRPYMFEKSSHVWADGSSVVAYPDYVELRRGSRTLSGLAAWADLAMSVGSGVDALHADAQAVSDNYFSVLGVRPALGRFFTPDEGAGPGAPSAIVISHAFWMRRFGGDSAAIRQRLVVDGRPQTIVGVAPPGFHGIDDGGVDLWIPVQQARFFGKTVEELGRSWLMFNLVGRLSPGTSRVQAEAELGTLLLNSVKRDAQDRNPTLRLGPVLAARGPAAGTRAQIARWLALGAALVLIIACANTANLLLARASVRRREIAIRRAVGATRERLVRQLLSESVVLGLVGAAGGLLLTAWGSQLVPVEGLPSLELFARGRVVWFAIAAALLSSVAFGLVPAIAATRHDVVSPLRDGGRAGIDHRSRLRSALLVVQIALAVVLLTGAGLFVHSLRNTQRIAPGIAVDELLVGRVDLRSVGYSDSAITHFLDLALERVRAIPGVKSATLTAMVPLQGSFRVVSFTVPDGVSAAHRGNDVDLRADLEGPWATQAFGVGPSYSATVGTPLVSGRDFTTADRETHAHVVIVNAAFATREWPHASAIGRCVDLGSGPDGGCYTVVGVASNAKYGTLEEPLSPALFLPLDDPTGNIPAMLIRTSGDPDGMVTAVRRALGELDASLPYVELQSLRDILRPMLQPRRLGAAMFGVFGVIALLLAAIGLYGVVSYAVAQRTHEIGVRIALGATRRHVASLALRQAFRVIVIGVAIGTVLSLGGARLVTHLLFGVNAIDPVTFVAVALALAATTVLACWIPTRRATRVDPMEALRVE